MSLCNIVSSSKLFSSFFFGVLANKLCNYHQNFVFASFFNSYCPFQRHVQKTMTDKPILTIKEKRKVLTVNITSLIFFFQLHLILKLHFLHLQCKRPVHFSSKRWYYKNFASFDRWKFIRYLDFFVSKKAATFTKSRIKLAVSSSRCLIRFTGFTRINKFEQKAARFRKTFLCPRITSI